MNVTDLCLCERPEPSGDDVGVYCTECECELTCPVCGMQYYSTNTFNVSSNKMSDVASNQLFAECMAICRGPNDSGVWDVVEFGHTAEQTFAHKDD